MSAAASLSVSPAILLPHLLNHIALLIREWPTATLQHVAKELAFPFGQPCRGVLL